MIGRILITGGLGYLGGRIAKYIAAHCGISPLLGSREDSAVSPTWLPHAKVVRMDWDSIEQLESVCVHADTVVHLAAMNENDCAVDPVGALLVNGVATVRLVEAAARAKVRRFIYLSTAHVYGAPLAGCITEKTLPRPRHPYATSHRAAEDSILAAYDSKQFTAAILRLSNGFGAPAQAKVNRWTLLVNDLCRQAVVQQRLVLRSAGLDQRDFITLEDVARAIVHIAVVPESHIGDGVFNVGSGQAVRVIEMAEAIAQRCQAILGFQPPIIKPESTNSVTQNLDYRIDKLLATGFTLQGSINDEIDATLRLCVEAFGGGS